MLYTTFKNQFVGKYTFDCANKFMIIEDYIINIKTTNLSQFPVITFHGTDLSNKKTSTTEYVFSQVNNHPDISELMLFQSKNDMIRFLSH